MQVMPSGDDDGVDPGILNDFGFVGGAIAKAELAPGVLGMRSGSGANRNQRGVGCSLHYRHEGPSGKDSGAEQADRSTGGGGELSTRRVSSLLRDQRERACLSLTFRVLNHHSQKWLARLPRDQVVGALCALNGEAMGDQSADVDSFLGEEPDKRFHIAGFGPTHVANGIVAPFLLIGCVVTSRTVRARNTEIEFLFVICFALDVHADGTYSDDDRAVASDGAGEIDGIAAGSFGCDEDGINP